MNYNSIGFICYSLKNHEAFSKDLGKFIKLFSDLIHYKTGYTFHTIFKCYLFENFKYFKFSEKNVKKVLNDISNGASFECSFLPDYDGGNGNFLSSISLRYNCFLSPFEGDINSISFLIKEDFYNKTNAFNFDEFLTTFKNCYLVFQSTYGLLMVNDKPIRMEIWLNGNSSHNVKNVELPFDYNLTKGRAWNLCKYNILLNRIRGAYLVNIINPKSIEILGGKEFVMKNCPTPIVEELEDNSLYIQTMYSFPESKEELILATQRLKKFLEPIKPDNDADINQVYKEHWE